MTNLHAGKKDTPKAAGEKLAAAKKVGVYSASGQVVRLSDPAVRTGVEKRKSQLAKNPKAARELLKKLGYLTASGKVSARYG
ncbi:hypothetical protein [Polaromonas sp. YR568]|uniref:hypothetical protein n=1 Tax=Polaromonas sp. YR568 TaxID=1855301 RepID=UPI00398C0A6B